jgi:DNA-directed RNA polymerase subunit RPC12/RpoP
MDIYTVKSKLLNGDFKLRSVSNSKSVAWEKFGIVVNVAESKDMDFVACKDCSHVLTYKGRQSGTSSLISHKCTD